MTLSLCSTELPSLTHGQGLTVDGVGEDDLLINAFRKTLVLSGGHLTLFGGKIHTLNLLFLLKSGGWDSNYF